MEAFTSVSVDVKHNDTELHDSGGMKALWHSAQEAKGRQYVAAIMEDPNADMIDECSIHCASHPQILTKNLR